MANSKPIKKEENYATSTGKITITATAGDGHFTTHRIKLNDKLIKYGEGRVEVTKDISAGDVIKVKSTINKPTGSSTFATVTIDLNQDENTKTYSYSEDLPEYDEVIYDVKILVE